MSTRIPSHLFDAQAVLQSRHAAQRMLIHGCEFVLRRLGVTLIATAVLALLVGCGSAATATGKGTLGGKATQPPVQIPAGWRLYRDPGGYFTLGLPPGWLFATTPPGHGILGGGSHGPLTTMEVETNFVPSGGNPQAMEDGLGFGVSYTVYTNSSGHLDQGAACTLYQHANTTLAGVKAESIPFPPPSTWMVGTSAATYQVNYHLPGQPPYGYSTARPTPQPSATVAAEQNLIGMMLATLRLTPATPPTC